jgi:transporter family protein
MWWFYALLSAFFAALTAIFVKLSVKDMDSDLATAIRTVIILFVTWGIVLFKGVPKNITALSSQGLLFLVLSGVATGLSWLFYFRALKLGDVSKVAPVDKLSLAMVIIFSVVFLGETLTVKAIIGIIFMVLGSLLIIL